MKLPYMKLWLGDWSADTLDYDATDAGAYQFLIFYAWRNGGMIRVEDLQRIARCPKRSWPRVKKRIQRAFDVVSNVGFWVHLRVQDELQAAHLSTENKRKGAMQMHSNRRARAHASHVINHTQLQSELVRTKTVTVEPGARARSNGSHGAGSKLSQAEQDRLIAEYERRHNGRPWQETLRHTDGMSPEKPPDEEQFGLPK